MSSTAEDLPLVVRGSYATSNTTSTPCQVLVLDHFRDPPAPLEIPGLLDIDDLVAELEAEEGGAEALREARTWAAGLFGADGETLQTLRLQRGLSQKELAERLGMQQPNIARWESGKGDMHLESCIQLAEALGVDMNTIAAAVTRQRARPESK